MEGGPPRREPSNTLLPYALLWWLTVPLAVLAGAFLVRIFIIFHDCGHGSFFKSKRANHIVGFITRVCLGILAASLVDDSGWCPVDQRAFESSKHQDHFNIGDAAEAGEMPKSGYAANSIAARIGISTAMVYELNDNKTIVGVAGAGGCSPTGAPEQVRMRQAEYARGWYENITSDAFG